MRAGPRFIILLAFSLILDGCTPAVYMHLYNATGQEIVVTKDKSKQVITISPNSVADFPLFYQPGERLLIRASRTL
jgi:hypothetical protein